MIGRRYPGPSRRSLGVTVLAVAMVLSSGCGSDEDGGGSNIPELPGGGEPLVGIYLSGGVAGFKDGLAIGEDGGAIATSSGIDERTRTFEVRQPQMKELADALAATSAEDVASGDACEESDATVDQLSVVFEVRGTEAGCTYDDSALEERIGTARELTTSILIQNRAATCERPCRGRASSP